MEPRRAVKIVIATAAVTAIPLLGACSDNSSDTTAETVTVSQSVSAPSSSQPSPSESATSGDIDLKTQKPAIAWRDAVATAKREAGGEPTSIRLSHDNRLVYEVEVVSGNSQTAIDIDATSGTVFGRDVDDDDGDANEVLDLNGVIEPGQAMDAATKVSAGRVAEWTLERDNGRVVYEVEVRTANDRVDVTVDAKTGQVIDVDD